MSKVKIKITGIFSFGAALLLMGGYNLYVERYSGTVEAVYVAAPQAGNQTVYGGGATPGGASQSSSAFTVSVDPGMNPLRVVLDVARSDVRGMDGLLYDLQLLDGSGKEVWRGRDVYHHGNRKKGSTLTIGGRVTIPLKAFSVSVPGSHLLKAYLDKKGHASSPMKEAKITLRRNVALHSPVVYGALGTLALAGFVLMILSKKRRPATKTLAASSK